MDKVRVRDLAKELGMETSKEVLAFLERIGRASCRERVSRCV